VWIIKRTEINEQIRDKEVRLIGEEGQQIGIISTNEAMDYALDKKMDLVKIAPNAKPPVCRVMDYGKFKYEQAKKDKEAKKKQKTTTVKEVRLSLNIEKHDMETKASNAIKFLGNGDKVKVSLRFKGRQMGHTEFGYKVIDNFAVLLVEYGQPEKRPKLEGRSLVVIFTPKK
jgi:translation initiation factor IF-3